MYRVLILALTLSLWGQPVNAQETRWVSDDIFIVLHTGPGTNYRWAAKLTPGSRLTQTGLSEDGKWAQVTTSRGSDGWVKLEHLTAQPPAQVRLPDALNQAQQLQATNSELSTELESLQAERDELLAQINSSGSELREVSEELAQLKQISGRAVQLDSDNRRLVEDAEDLRASLEMLEAENQRLNDRLRNEAFIDGALAVLLGVVITLVVPRLWPKRRKSSSWA